MRILNLNFSGIGPFLEGSIDFFDPENEVSGGSVTIITGENGSGKSIIIDAIRSLLLGPYTEIERDIFATGDATISADIDIDEVVHHVIGNKRAGAGRKSVKNNFDKLSMTFTGSTTSSPPKFFTSFWSSKLASDDFKLSSIEPVNVHHYLQHSLDGVHRNIDLVRTICFFDYLRTSGDEDEAKTGNMLYSAVEKIISQSVNGGYLSHISRKDLTPIITVFDSKIEISKLSSGSLYLIQRYVSILAMQYGVYSNYPNEFADLFSIPGLLLIDEAENHLHPKWQKTFISNIIDLFPNIQVIITTHSPFIVSSVPEARIFVCSRESQYSVVENKTHAYANKPVEEILASPLFNTSPFNKEITELLQDRKDSIKSGDTERVNEIEEKLKTMNPSYFNIFEIDTLLKSITDK